MHLRSTADIVLTGVVTDNTANHPHRVWERRDARTDTGPGAENEAPVTRTAIALRALGICTITAAMATGAISPTFGAASPGRVRNVTQDTSGRSLIRMVERAEDADQLRVQGTCRAGLSITKNLEISGVPDRATLTGLDRSRVLEIRR